METLLPGRKILLDGTIYLVHGLVHGNPWIKINPSFKKLVATELKNENVLCEDGFVSWIPNSVSMRETEYFSFGKMPPLKKIRFLSHFLYDYLISRFKKDNLNILEKIRNINSLEDLIEVRNFLFAGYHSEPEGMNDLMKKNNSGTIDNPRGKVPLIIRRYIYEAKTSINYVKENDLKELHIVVGCAHELPLEYLLNNKKVLDIYSL